MEGSRVCQICNRCFSSGKAMGGHMRSHFAKLLLSTPTHMSSPSSSSSAFHPPNLSPPLSPQSSPDRRLPFIKDSVVPSHDGQESINAKPGSGSHKTDNKRCRGSSEEVVESPAESGQGSLASDVTFSDEEGAKCLVMLSRDTWPSAESEAGESREYGDSDDCEDDETIRRIQEWARNKGRFKCETCNKVFGSYQALGGHRAGHKKVKLHRKKDTVLLEDGGGENCWPTGNGDGNKDGGGGGEKIFECTYCGKVFESGQALGGHKKVHLQLTGNSPNCSGKGKVARKIRRSRVIDLNQLPDPKDRSNEGSKSIRRRIF